MNTQKTKRYLALEAIYEKSKETMATSALLVIEIDNLIGYGKTDARVLQASRNCYVRKAEQLTEMLVQFEKSDRDGWSE